MTRELWYTIATKVAPSFVREYRKPSVQSAGRFCDIVPLSCETLVYWFINISYSKWEKEWEAAKRFREEHGEDTPLPTRTRNRGVNGQNYTAKELSEYCKIHRYLKEQRPKTEDWDSYIIKRMKREIRERNEAMGVLPIKKKQKIVAEEAIEVPLDGILSSYNSSNCD